jgi:hypothetical protein
MVAKRPTSRLRSRPPLLYPYGQYSARRKPLRRRIKSLGLTHLWGPRAGRRISGRCYCKNHRADAERDLRDIGYLRGDDIDTHEERRRHADPEQGAPSGVLWQDREKQGRHRRSDRPSNCPTALYAADRLAAVLRSNHFSHQDGARRLRRDGGTSQARPFDHRKRERREPPRASCGGATCPLASPSIPGRRSDDGCEPPNPDPARSHH